ncbi:four helix bundle protein [Thermodesulfobacteriota bacterium]
MVTAGVNLVAKPHQKLDVWKRSIEFVKRIYTVTGDFPDEEKFGIVSQMRRAAVSIPKSSPYRPGKCLRVGNANHHLQGTRTQFIPEDSAQEVLSELETISRMIIGLQRSLN